MINGILWFDSADDKSIDSKLEQAARHYEHKFGTTPTLAYVHPRMMIGAAAPIAGMEVRVTNTVLPNHFWIGVTEERENASYDTQ